MKIIPAIDIIEGKCVRLTEGDYATQKIYNTIPLEVAKEFEDNGIQYLHLVDLDGAKAGKITNWKVLETIANKTALQIDFGGGLKSNEDLEIAFNCGAKKITGGSIAIKNPELFVEWIKIHKEKIILGADVRNKFVAVTGWTEDSKTTIEDLLNKYLPLGITEVICTDISKDGKLEGLNFELYEEIIQKNKSIQLIASGGVKGIEDIEKCLEKNLSGVIIGKAIYEGKISLKQLSKFISYVS